MTLDILKKRIKEKPNPEIGHVFYAIDINSIAIWVITDIVIDGSDKYDSSQKNFITKLIYGDEDEWNSAYNPSNREYMNDDDIIFIGDIDEYPELLLL